MSTPKSKQPLPYENAAVMNAALLRGTLSTILRGGLSLRGGHMPDPAHAVPRIFAGVGVTTSDDPAVDAYVLEKIEELGVSQVRVDFSYDDLHGPVARLLDKLLETKTQVLLHLIQPYREAQQMKTANAQQRWRDFIEAVCRRFGARVWAIEIGSTINRRRWAGYDNESFFACWSIAYQLIKARHITLAGPNISDFEPLYNIAVLKKLHRDNQLPDIQTNNLFSERVIEPERFDQRIFGTRLALKLKVNLVKKARLIQKIGRYFGVSRLMSPAAFWTLPRIERLLVHSEQKQADYLSRYFTLLAASGATQQVFWGPLLCWREGLIDDGSGRYPPLERITHYKSVIGERPDFRPRPAFSALQNWIKQVEGSYYVGPRLSAVGIEVHVFEKNDRQVHVMWCENGRALPLKQLYMPADLARAEFTDRDGETFDARPQVISETPIFVSWPRQDRILTGARPTDSRFESIYRHNQRFYHVIDDANYRGMVCADDAPQAQAIAEAMSPENLPGPQTDTILRSARNVIWTVTDPQGQIVTAKKPQRMHAHKRLLDRYRPSKARRSWIAANELLRRGVNTARPIAYFERHNDTTLMDNLFLCELVDHDFTTREMLTAFQQGATEFQGIAAEDVYRQLADFLLLMHGRAVYFRDLAGGNILVKKQGQTLKFTLIDVNRARFYYRQISFSQRLSDLTRICNKLHWAGREQLVGFYLRGMPGQKTFNWRRRLPFYLYDFKVDVKRKYGRRAIKRLVNRLRGQHRQ